MNNRILIIAVVVLVILGAAGFMLTKNSTSTMPAAVPTPTQAMMKVMETPTASPSEAMNPSGAPAPSDAMKAKTGSVKEFTVAASNFKFAPTTLTVKKGDTVKITFTNSGGFHDFVIDELNVKTKTIPAGQSEIVQFVADKAGTYKYYCSVGNHRAMGMEGTLTVQ